MCTRPKLVDLSLFPSNPMFILGRRTGQHFYKFAPCQCCIECRNMRREEYTQRLKHEIQTSGHIASFITLTYRDDELPVLKPYGSAVVGSYFGSVPPACGSTLSRKDAKQFCDKLSKRFHRKYGKRSLKYVCVGEYGDDGHRPHLHLIVVGLPANERKMVYEAWNKGRIDIEPAGNGSIRYTLSYIDKQVFGANALYDQYGDFEPPFALFSKGIGEKWIRQNLNKFNKYGVYRNGSYSYTLNPYYRRKFGFECKPYETVFSASVVDFAKKYNLDLVTAYKKRCSLMESSAQHKQIKRREPLYNVDKVVHNRDFSKYTRGFTDYDLYDNGIRMTKSLIHKVKDILYEDGVTESALRDFSSLCIHNNFSGINFCSDVSSHYNSYRSFDFDSPVSEYEHSPCFERARQYIIQTARRRHYQLLQKYRV